MQSKNKPRPTAAERAHIAMVKALPCSVCDDGGGRKQSEAHEIKQGCWWLAVALCPDCHRGPMLGLHGERRAWAVRKMDEMDALAVTIQRLMAHAAAPSRRAA